MGLAIAACQAGYSVYFTSLDDMVRNLREAESTGRFAKKLQTYLKPAVLVLDEVGYLPLSRAEGNMVFQLVSRRYERGSDHPHEQQDLRRDGPGLRRRGARLGDPRPPAASRRGDLDQRQADRLRWATSPLV